MGPRADEKYEKRGLERTKVRKMGPKKCLTPAPSQKVESGRSKSGPFVIEDYFLMTVFIRGAPMENNTTQECIGTVAPKYGLKTLNYTNTMRTCTDTIRTANDTPRIPVHAT